MLARLSRLWQRSRPEPPTAVADARPVTEEWVRGRRASPRLHTTLTRDAIERLAHRDPARVGATIAAAERVLGHQFELLGSGPFVPVDVDRTARDGYVPIDWYLDPVRALRFPRGVPHKQWNLDMRPGNADIKYPWELARCQHWAVLTQAYQLTREDRFAVEIARELDDFAAANPTGVGVNWTCTMDVGLRAVSWTIAIDAVHSATALDDAFFLRAYRAMHDHGVFIRNNLENTYEVTSNHYLSNLLGLLFLGRAFCGLDAGDEWSAFAHDAIGRELDVQVLPDGADYESSVPYHRLVAELFLGALRASDHSGRPMSSHYRSRVADMIGYLAAVLRPDGLMPQVGDADDGRLHVFEGYASTCPQDPRHLFGPASAMYHQPEWAALGGGAGAWEAAWWGLEALGPVDRPVAAERAVLFRESGVGVAATDAGDYLLVTNGVVGTNGFGNHKHNDLLSFEYHSRGTPLIVDPGSYVYTSDAAARNAFRSTASHNTIMIDGTEQNDIRPDWLFRMFEAAHPEWMSFDAAASVVRCVARHHGYERLPDAVTHERTFAFEKASGRLAITDRLVGRGSHHIAWHFHLAPGIHAEAVAGTVVLTAAGRRWTMTLPGDVSVQIARAAYSPSYGVKVPCMALDLSVDVALEGGRSWEFVVER